MSGNVGVPAGLKAVDCNDCYESAIRAWCGRPNNLVTYQYGPVSGDTLEEFNAAWLEYGGLTWVADVDGVSGGECHWFCPAIPNATFLINGVAVADGEVVSPNPKAIAEDWARQPAMPVKECNSADIKRAVESIDSTLMNCEQEPIRLCGFTPRCYDTNNDGVADLTVLEYRADASDCLDSPISWVNPVAGNLVQDFITGDGVTGRYSSVIANPTAGHPSYVDGVIQIDMNTRHTFIGADPADNITTIDFDDPVLLSDFRVRSMATNPTGSFNESQIVLFYLGGVQVQVPLGAVIAGGGTYDPATGDLLTNTISPEFEVSFTADTPIDRITIQQRPESTADNIGVRLRGVCAATIAKTYDINSVFNNLNDIDAWTEVTVPNGAYPVSCNLFSCKRLMWDKAGDCFEVSEYRYGCAIFESVDGNPSSALSECPPNIIQDPAPTITCSSCSTVTVPTSELETGPVTIGPCGPGTLAEVEACLEGRGCSVTTEEIPDPDAPAPMFVTLPNWTAAQLADLQAGNAITITTGLTGSDGNPITLDITLDEGPADEGSVGALAGQTGVRKHVTWASALSGNVTNLIPRAPAGTTTGNNRINFAFSDDVTFQIDDIPHSFTAGYERNRITSDGTLTDIGNLSTRPEGYVEGDGTTDILFKSNQMAPTPGGNWGATGTGSQISYEYWRAHRPGGQAGEAQADDGEYGQDPFRLRVSQAADTLTVITVECADEANTLTGADIVLGDSTTETLADCADYVPNCSQSVADGTVKSCLDALLVSNAMLITEQQTTNTLLAELIQCQQYIKCASPCDYIAGTQALPADCGYTRCVILRVDATPGTLSDATLQGFTIELSDGGNTEGSTNTCTNVFDFAGETVNVVTLPTGDAVTNIADKINAIPGFVAAPCGQNAVGGFDEAMAIRGPDCYSWELYIRTGGSGNDYGLGFNHETGELWELETPQGDAQVPAEVGNNSAFSNGYFAAPDCNANCTVAIP